MSGQMGPVEPGRPPGQELPMDADLALKIVRDTFDGMPAADSAERADDEAAYAALRQVVNTARAYVKGRSVGRFVALCQALQEPADRPRKAEVSDDEVERFLAERSQMRITREAATRLGLIMPGEFRHLAPDQDRPGGTIR